MDQSIIRISKELSDLQKGSDLSLAVACRDIDVRNVKALIIGPHETPYEFGFFEFAIRFSKDYPSKSPTVLCATTNNGRCRFNPNIYANGKVCLSILGTWRGESSEEWSSAQGMESVLLSIQSLMSSNPYENEPGFERPRDENEKKSQKQYAQKIRHETLRISVIMRLEAYLNLRPDGSQIIPIKEESCHVDIDDDVDETNIPFEPFTDLCKRRFLWYYESYQDAVEKGMKEVKANEKFPRMPFETPHSNSMDGHYNYEDLGLRLKNIKNAIDAETKSWAEQGQKAFEKDNTVSVNLMRQFEQVEAAFKESDLPHNVMLENGNPFVWLVTYIGQPMTNLDGGLFRIKLCFSPRFPEEQPRVRFETKIFHHLIASDGTVCYTPNPSRKEDVRQHIEAIIASVEEEEPAYDPRKTVNLEASRIFWNGGKENKKLYNRKLRRSIQESMEDFPE